MQEIRVPLGLRARIRFLSHIPRQVGLRRLHLCSVLREIRFRLRDLGCKRTGIDHEQRVTLLHVRAFLKTDLGKFSADLGFNRDSRIGFGVSHRLNFKWNGL